MLGPMRSFGTTLHPRLLILGFENDADLVAALKEAVPTSERIDSLDQVETTEWDVIITERGADGIPPGLFVLARVGGRGGHRQFGFVDLEGGSQGHVLAHESSRAREFKLSDGLNPGLRSVAESLGSRAVAQGEHPVLQVLEYSVAGGSVQHPEALTPFLLTSDHRIVAGGFTRQAGYSRCWVIPPYEDQVVNWLRVALDEWSELDPARFPLRTDWREEERWQIPKERELVAKVHELDAERNDLLAKIEAQMREIRAQLGTAQVDGEVDRQLLTEQGDVLVEAVRRGLTTLGFEVQEMDKIWTTGDRREDLRVSDPTAPGWEAIVEVRGYKRGAELSDLMRLNRFAKRYQQDEGRFPDASWYVVNHFIGDSPSERSLVLASHLNEVKAFGDDDGLVIDTRDLFDLVLKCELAALQAADTREALRKGRARFTS